MLTQKTGTAIKLVLADDHEIFRDGFRVMLKKQAGIALVGEAANGRELIEQVMKLKPDVVITDIKMPVLNGIEATKEILKLLPSTGIIALSMFDEENLIVDMLDAGAKGYLLKNAQKQEIFDAIACVYGGKVYYCNHTSAKLINLLATSTYNKKKVAEKQASFTPKEIEVIQLICAEKSTKEIAAQTGLDARNVEKYRERIYKKTGAKNAVGLVVHAIQQGIYKI